jgi:3-oxoacyl-[acyl-carrier protein] reductase
MVVKYTGGEMGKLGGRVALVTGAGRGIGRAVALMLASEGASVVVSDLDEAPALETENEIAAAGGRAVALAGDVAADGFGEQAVELMLDHFGGIDIIVNNAGYIWNTTIQNTTDEQWQAMLDVHATAPFRILRAATPFLRRVAQAEQEAGEIRRRKVVNISSVSGLYGAATQLAYSAGKAAVIGITKTLSKEWGRYGVNVNCVAFGFIGTRLTQSFEEDPATIEVHGRSLKVGFPARVAEAMEPRIPLGRAGTVEEAAGAVTLLCLPESDYISGQVLICDGGAGGI